MWHASHFTCANRKLSWNASHCLLGPKQYASYLTCVPTPWMEGKLNHNWQSRSCPLFGSSDREIVFSPRSLWSPVLHQGSWGVLGDLEDNKNHGASSKICYKTQEHYNNRCLFKNHQTWLHNHETKQSSSHPSKMIVNHWKFIGQSYVLIGYR